MHLLRSALDHFTPPAIAFTPIYFSGKHIQDHPSGRISKKGSLRIPAIGVNPLTVTFRGRELSTRPHGESISTISHVGLDSSTTDVDGAAPVFLRPTRAACKTRWLSSEHDRYPWWPVLAWCAPGRRLWKMEAPLVLKIFFVPLCFFKTLGFFYNKLNNVVIMTL